MVLTKIGGQKGWEELTREISSTEECSRLLGQMLDHLRELGYDEVSIYNLLRSHLPQLAPEDPWRREKLTITQATLQYQLTRREHTILQELMAGKENAVICDELAISVNTLKKHILNVYRKLGVRNRVQLFKMIREKE